MLALHRISCVNLCGTEMIWNLSCSWLSFYCSFLAGILNETVVLTSYIFAYGHEPMACLFVLICFVWFFFSFVLFYGFTLHCAGSLPRVVPRIKLWDLASKLCSSYLRTLSIAHRKPLGLLMKQNSLLKARCIKRKTKMAVLTFIILGNHIELFMQAPQPFPH